MVEDAAKDAERIPLGELITLLPAWRSWAGASAAGVARKSLEACRRGATDEA